MPAAVVLATALHGCASHRAQAERDAEDAGPEDAADRRDVALPSSGCSVPSGPRYKPGTTTGELSVDSRARSFRVHVPPRYDGSAPLPLVLMFHGGGGSGRQFEENSSRMDAVADRESFVVVYPDGSGVLKSWNGVGCCGYAVENDIDDVGFVTALLDHVEGALCLDRRRLYAAGMSNGAILSHRLGCELSARLSAIAPVAGTDMTRACAPARPLPVMEIHGTADGHVPWDGGAGCGPTNVDFTSVPTTLERWRRRNGCSDQTEPYLEQNEVRCERAIHCAQGADVVACAIQGGGHNWPGGEPPADLVPCPGNGFQSAFSASEAVWTFFRDHPLP